ncbi:MAG: vitamin B12 dependent-methionine synthase activation domain-containing protein [Desulfobacteraceae bacterium]|jgi:hypothetical protein
MLEAETIPVDADRLRVSPQEVGRYAGGSRYKLDARMKSLATTMLETARVLVKPVYTYVVHSTELINPQKGIRLKTGSYIEIPEEENDPQIVSLAAVVCTLGSALEKETHRLMENGDLLTAMFLDAAGVAKLEMLAHMARIYIKNMAAEVGLFTGCPFGPGYNNMPVDSQSILFDHLDAESIGVRLNESGVMLPMKSISFWLRVTRDEKAAEGYGYKCQKCEMQNCLYRKGL